MGDPDDDAPLLAAAPRHLRRRAFHEEIPDTLLVPGVEPIVEAARPEKQASPPGSVKPMSADGVALYRRKRRLALSILVILSLSVPFLLLLLLVSA